MLDHLLIGEDNMKHGVSKKGIIRRDVKNKNKWVFEVYFADKDNGKIIFRKYPNVISARYLSKKSATKALDKYMRIKKLDFYDEVRR